MAYSRAHARSPEGMYAEDDVGAVGVDGGPRNPVISAYEGTSRVRIPAAGMNPIDYRPGHMPPGTRVIVGPNNGMGGIQMNEGPDLVPVGSEDMPARARDLHVFDRQPAELREMRPDGRGGTRAWQFQYDPRAAQNHGTMDSREPLPIFYVTQQLATQGVVPGWLGTWLQDRATRLERPPRDVLRLLERRQDGAPYLSYARQLNHVLDAYEAAGHRVKAE